ncbi:Pr6Pr family membrane protein [Herbiconiux sp. A18JL235]|uniref:Pr6Pr family membrane protein n=1 Tax=Herbiconiux sp. A18JL235 TaxID=3152363 RepID=A0AB39BFI8_9MICO
MRRIFGVVRVIAAGVIVAAVVGQLVHSLSLGQPDLAHFLVNFFSFFTILSNALAAIALLVGAWFCFTTRVDPPWFNLGYAAVTTYMATTGVVYNLLLRNIELPQGQTLEWSNEILHVWAPLYVVLVWIVSPGKRALPWSAIWAIIVFPIVWAVYTLIRGPIVGWYPYPFLNPAQPGGYGTVVIYVAGIAGFIALAASGVVALSRTRVLGRRKRATRA